MAQDISCNTVVSSVGSIHLYMTLHLFWQQWFKSSHSLQYDHALLLVHLDFICDISFSWKPSWQVPHTRTIIQKNHHLRFYVIYSILTCIFQCGEKSLIHINKFTSLLNGDNTSGLCMCTTLVMPDTSVGSLGPLPNLYSV